MRVVVDRRRPRRARAPRCGCRAPGTRSPSSSSASGPAAAPTSCATAGFTWDTGPVADHDAVGARGDVRRGRARPPSRGHAAPARPALPDPLGGRGRALRLRRRPRRGCARRSRSSPRATPRASTPFLAALRADLRATAILGAGRRRVPLARATSRGSCRRWCGSARCAPLHAFVARFFEHPRVREAFSFHSLFIGGDPYRVPAIYGALVYLQVARRRLVRRRRRLLARRGDGAPARRALRRARSRRSSTPAARVTGRAARGRRADRRRRRRLQRRRPAHARAARPPPAAPPAARRRCRASCSTSARTAPFDERCCTTRCSSATATATSSAPSRAGRELPRTFSTYVHAPARTEPAMAPPGGDSLARAAAGPQPARAAIDWDARGRRAARRARRRPGDDVRADGPRRGRARRAPDDAAGLRARARRRRGATRSRSSRRCTSRPTSASPTATGGSRGLYFVGGGTHPGRGHPGVLLGAEVTAGPGRAPTAARPRRRRWR